MAIFGKVDYIEIEPALASDHSLFGCDLPFILAKLLRNCTKIPEDAVCLHTLHAVCFLAILAGMGIGLDLNAMCASNSVKEKIISSQ